VGVTEKFLMYLSALEESSKGKGPIELHHEGEAPVVGGDFIKRFCAGWKR
jgi:hypothetical protein